MNWRSDLRVRDRQTELAREAALVRQVRMVEGRSVRLRSRR
ncbi:MAG TPA: hypothetical protein VLQ79_12560 [Myxococcaceae bacterium]|nr:hypothetical protein [Myxococcaceae bacterium]